MLVKHCPCLRELTLDGDCSQLKNLILPILKATWPELQSLSIGITKRFNERPVLRGEARAAQDFIGRHHELRSLQLLGEVTSEMTDGITSHGNLTAFRGRCVHLKAATNLPRLRSVHLTDPHMGSTNYLGILRRFWSITTLGLTLDSEWESMQGVCLSVFEACPMVVHLDLRLAIMSRDPTNYMINIGESIRKAVHLRSLTLACSTSLSWRLTTGALTIILNNPNLDSVALYSCDKLSKPEVSQVMFDYHHSVEFVVSRDRSCEQSKRLSIKEVRRIWPRTWVCRCVKEISKGQDLLFIHAQLPLWSIYE
ncbi:hypothetical protein P691DRAFT_296544 [Macrolepiota fuliginosa MF-IS2]|uniref:F-box domain-containing protein n=1 Tax=Macrolepiota fuliginosa MF-IS2 TaxID=1400762 RepID=A0A9P5XJ80_9AGAR|nr:hypothetical protein P691DRAFT_296544 [Macrolepiota fuliginosa MF-IS2]